MEDFELQRDEILLVSSGDAQLSGHSGERVHHLQCTGGSLALTDRNLIWVSTLSSGFLGLKKERILERFPLSRIKMFQGRPRAQLEEGFGEDSRLTFYFDDCVLEFTFDDDKKAPRAFVNQLNRAVTGADEDIYVTNAIPGAEFIADTIRDTVDVFRERFGFKKAPEQVVRYCSGCGASLSGLRGSVLSCPYCGCRNKLE